MKHIVLALTLIASATAATAMSETGSGGAGHIVHSDVGELRISTGNDSR